MDNEKKKINKNTIFNRALYITIPDDDNGNGGMLSNGLKSLGDSYNGDTPGKRFLTSSLLKKIEEGTPVTEKNIRIDLEKMKISDSYNNENNNIENNNLNDDFNNDKSIKLQKKSSFNNNEFIYDNQNDDKNNNDNDDNNEYFHDNHFVVSEDEDEKKDDNKKKRDYNNNNNNYNYNINNIHNNINNNINNNNNKIITNNNKIITNNNISNNNNNELKKRDSKELKEEEYIFEKFGKRGWQCAKCNNFNFESRIKCNRCLEMKDPKTLEEIKKELEEKNSGDKKKKPLIERKGDWQCPQCHNLNFAFRQECNRCHLSKEVYLNYQNKIQQQGNNFGINLMNQPQIIQNQINLIQNFGFVPNVYNGMGRGIDNNNINNNFNKISNINNNNQNYNMNNNFYNWNLQQNSLQSKNYETENYYNHNFN